jgi:glycosyltransferase involved in cell wall biosynthesis
MISVVIPLYNKEQSIRNTIHSVLNQTFKEFELIIINDGSTDNSLSVIHSESDPRIVIIDKTNGGVSSARNLGIKQAKYNYVAFLDGDDLWFHNHLSIIYSLITSYPHNNVAGYVTRFLKSSTTIVNDKSCDEVGEPFIITDYFEFAKKPTDLLSSSNFVINKEVAIKVGLYDENLVYGEDVEFWYRLFKNHHLIVSQKTTALYYTGAENRSTISVVPIEKRFHKFTFVNVSTNERQYLGKLICLMIIDYLMQGAPKFALKVFFIYKRHTLVILRYAFALLFKRLSR